MDIHELDSPDAEVRMAAAKALGAKMEQGALKRTVLEEVNNHVHTTWSFSPYEPAAAAWHAWEAGLGIVGSIDHDSIGAAREMQESCRLFGMASTVGFEMRVRFEDPFLSGRRINNPDSVGIAYMCVHAVPRQSIDEVDRFLEPVRTSRGKRNRSQVEALQSLVGPYGYDLDYERDVLPLSKAAQGGSVTERHILFAMALQTIDMVGKGEPLVRFVRDRLHIPLSPATERLLLDEQNPYCAYDLLGLFKGFFLSRFFIQPGKEECFPVEKVVGFANRIGAIAAYAYLGDVEQDVTGDKKQQRYEDGFLDELVDILAGIGFPAVTYMPPRNTTAQMERLHRLCRERGLMEISGVDINSPRQRFNCPDLLDPCCRHLVDSAWALVAHEQLSATDLGLGLFCKDGPFADLPLEQRIERYAALGRRMDPRHPLDIVDQVG
jgi:hypothetical protein